MPTYDYVCQACDHQFELFQQMSAPVKRKCPECGKQKLERLIGTGAGVIFKGGGFYETDYRSDSYKKGAEAEKKASSDKKDGTSSDSKSKPAKAESSSGASSDATKGSGDSKKSSKKKSD